MRKRVGKEEKGGEGEGVRGRKGRKDNHGDDGDNWFGCYDDNKGAGGDGADDNM